MAARVAAVLPLLLMLAPVAQSQVVWSPDLAARVDKVFERMDRPTSPGCALAVIGDGRLLYARGYGMANLDHDVVITSSTVFHVASVSKEFTAAAILLLAADGRLTLDDEVRRYVPELPDFGRRITIRHLLHHTSGLRDQWELLGLAGWRYSLDLITDADVLEVMARQRALNFEPGSQHLYCNTGYTLLALVVKRVSGQSFAEFTTERLFAPLGMTRTHFRDDHAEIIKGQAYGYVPSGNTFRLSLTNFDTAGATSLHTTVEDMAAWDRNFYDGRVGGRALVDELTRRGVLTSGETIDYARGLTISTYRGLPTVGHGGSDAGYRSDFVRFPSERLSIVCLCNLSTAGPGELTRRVADLVLGDRLGPAATDTRPEVVVPSAELASYAGLYADSDRRAFRRFRVSQDGALQVGFGERGVALRSLGGARFASAAADLDFSASGGRMHLTETPRSGSAKPVVFARVDVFTPTAAGRAEYAGAYRSDEVEPVFRVVDADGALTLRRLKAEPEPLQPLVADVFMALRGTVRFTRDPSGRVVGLVWDGGRVRNFQLTKDEGRKPAGPR